MHNLDRTQLEAEEETGFEFESEEEDFLGALVGPATQIIGGLLGGELESPFSEMEEVELAAELLEVSNEDELEDFLGDLISKAGNAVGSFVRSDTGRQLTGILKGAAKQALPTVGRAVGDWIAPGQGGQIGSQLASAAGNLLGLELEGLSAQEAEFETARGVVRFSGAAAARAAAAPRNMPAKAAASKAATAAAQTHAPGLLQQQQRRATRGRPTGGPPSRRSRQTTAARRAATGTGRRRGARPTGPGGTTRPRRDRRGLISASYGLPDWVAEPADFGGAPDDGAYAPSQDDGYDVAYGDEPGGYAPSHGRGTGRWIRRGQSIVLLGI